MQNLQHVLQLPIRHGTGDRPVAQVEPATQLQHIDKRAQMNGIEEGVQQFKLADPRGRQFVLQLTVAKRRRGNRERAVPLLMPLALLALSHLPGPGRSC